MEAKASKAAVVEEAEGVVEAEVKVEVVPRSILMLVVLPAQ